MHYVYVNIRIFHIDFPTETMVLCHYRKLSLWILSSIRMLIFISENHEFFWFRQWRRSIDLWVVFDTSNELHQKLCMMALVLRWSSLALNILSIWQQIAIDSMFLYAMIYLRLLPLSIAFRNCLMRMVIIWMSWTLTSPNTCDT